MGVSNEKRCKREQNFGSTFFKGGFSKSGKLLKYNLILYSSIKYGKKVHIGKP